MEYHRREQIWLYELPGTMILDQAAQDFQHGRAGSLVVCYGTKCIYDYDNSYHDVILWECEPVQLEIQEIMPRDIWQPMHRLKARVLADVPRGRLKPGYQDDLGLSVLKANLIITIYYWPDDHAARIADETEL